MRECPLMGTWMPRSQLWRRGFASSIASIGAPAGGEVRRWRQLCGVPITKARHAMTNYGTGERERRRGPPRATRHGHVPAPSPAWRDERQDDGAHRKRGKAEKN